MITACHSCKRGLGEWCIQCKRIAQDDIRIEHAPHNRDELTAATLQPQSPPRPLANLPAEAEDALRQAVMALTDLDPLDALLLLHVAKGGTPSSFGKTLLSVIVKAERYTGDGMSRATASYRWRSICDTFAPFAALRQWPKGHGGRKPSNTPERPQTFTAT